MRIDSEIPRRPKRIPSLLPDAAPNSSMIENQQPVEPVSVNPDI